jgi:hypothetical protein
MTVAILRYLDRVLPTPALTPADPRQAYPGKNGVGDGEILRQLGQKLYAIGIGAVSSGPERG